MQSVSYTAMTTGLEYQIPRNVFKITSSTSVKRKKDPMSFLKDASIRTKILFLVIPSCLVSIAGILVISKDYKSANTTYSNFVSNDADAEIKMAIASQRLVSVVYDAYQTVYYSAQTPEMKRAQDDYQASTKRLFELLNEAKSLIPEQRANIDNFDSEAEAIVAITDQAVKAGSVDQNDEAKKRLLEADARISTTLPKMRTWINSYSKGIVEKTNALSRRTNDTILYTLLGIGSVVAITIGLALLLTARGITGPIEVLRSRMISLAEGQTEALVAGADRRDEVGQMARAVAVFRENAIERIRLEQEADAGRSVLEDERLQRETQRVDEAANTKFAVDGLANGLQQLSSGNVAYRISTPFVAELDGLRRDFNASLEKLHQTLVQVGQNAHGIDAGANEIRSAADDLAKRTEQQAASVEETAAALEEITTTVKDSARRAEEAGAIVAKARVGAEKSGEVVRRAVGAMQAIEKSSTEISNIIGVIDEIAFQTNLLALNAGVEAARAGEAGKGFAVVAQEVRELAQRSATAAKEIKSLIAVSVAHVRSGVDLVGETGTSLQEIVAEVQEINSHVGAIVEAAKEQSTGLHEINTAVNTVDQGTQQNAAMVEQSTAASHSLAKDAAALKELLSQFKLGPDDKLTPQIASSNSVRSTSPARALGLKIVDAFGRPRTSAVQTASAAWEEF